jgi:hypothetical protein
VLRVLCCSQRRGRDSGTWNIYIYTYTHEYYEAQCSRVSTTWAFEGTWFVFEIHGGHNMACLRIILKLIFIFYINHLQCKKSRLTLSSSLAFHNFPFLFAKMQTNLLSFPCTQLLTPALFAIFPHSCHFVQTCKVLDLLDPTTDFYICTIQSN